MADDRRPKRLNEMDDLRDLWRFPVPIYVGATGNILTTIVLTYLLQGRAPRYALPLWAGGTISANVLPVFLLRTGLDERTPYPPIEAMHFFADRHTFST